MKDLNESQQLGRTVLRIVAVGCLAIGILVGRFSTGCSHKTDAAADIAPEASTESMNGFQPTDTAPYCLPSGTVAYEVCDGQTHTRYWVLRWPEGKGYSIVPRMVYKDGELVPYWPEYGASDDES